MLALIALGLFAAPPCVLHDKHGRPIENLCGDKPAPIVYHIPIEFMDRAKDEVALITLLHQDLAETQGGMLNLETRRKIKALMLKLEKEDQNRTIHDK